MILNKDAGFVKTYNKMGYMFNEISNYGREFINFSKNSIEPVLDIAAAFGTITLPLLESGAKNVIANDLDIRHLESLKEKTPIHLRDRLQIIAGHFPNSIDFPKNYFHSVMLSHVMHFLTGEEVIAGLEKVYTWLKPGGKVFIVAGTPYVGIVKRFIPEFKKRKLEGMKWPGIVEDLSLYQHARCSDLPEWMNYLDDDILLEVLSSVGFMVDKISLFARPDFPVDMQLDGKENVGAIATKPLD